MITMNEFVDLRMQQQIAHEIYRQQIMQRIPGKIFISLKINLKSQLLYFPQPRLEILASKIHM